MEDLRGLEPTPIALRPQVGKMFINVLKFLFHFGEIFNLESYLSSNSKYEQNFRKCFKKSTRIKKEYHLHPIVYL